MRTIRRSRQRSRAATALALSLAVMGTGFAPLLDAAPSWAEEAEAQPESGAPGAATPAPEKEGEGSGRQGDRPPRPIEVAKPESDDAGTAPAAAPEVSPASLPGMCEPNTYYVMDRNSAANSTRMSVKKATYSGNSINTALTAIDGNQPLDVTGMNTATPDVNGNTPPSTHYLNALGVATSGDVWFIDQRGVYGQAGVTNPMVDVYHYSEGHDGNPPLHLAFPSMSLNSPQAGYVVGGAVDQMAQTFYFGYFTDSNPNDPLHDTQNRRFHLYRAAVSNLGQLEPQAGEVAHIDFPVPDGFTRDGGQMNGDIAFDADGNLQVVVGETSGQSLRVQINRSEFVDLPGRQSGRTINGVSDGVRGSAGNPLKVPTLVVDGSFVLTPTTPTPQVNGVAFTDDGRMITERGNTNVIRDNTSFDALGATVTMSGVSGDLVDLASCATPEIEIPQPGFELTKTADPESGTSVQAGDRITYTVTGSNTGSTVLDPATVADDLSGVLDKAQYEAGSLQASIVDGMDGNVVDVTGQVQFDAGAADLAWTGALQPGDVITITYSVIVNAGVEGETLANRVTGSGTPPGLPPIVPPPSTTEHPVPGFAISKEADPVSGTEVQPGDTITYTVTGTNTGATLLDPATLTDDLSGVLAHAAYNDDAAAEIDGTPAADPTRTGDTLSWEGPLEPGQSVTITYSVRVNADAADVTIHNLLTGSATPQTPDPENPTGPPIPGTPIVPPQEETEHPVPGKPGFDIAKSADPASGTAVDPGATITYTVTGTNTGSTALDPATLSDDLSKVLTFADYNDDASAEIDGAAAADPTRSGDTLTWTGALEPGETVTLTYSVAVHADAGGQLIENLVTGEGTPEGCAADDCVITPPPTRTEHPVKEPDFALAKSASPASGTAVDPGATITYTVTGTNTGETVLDPAVLTDDLSEVLNHAAYNNDATATVGGVAAGSVVFDAAAETLTWRGTLQPDEVVTVTYTVRVDADAAGVTLRNHVTGEGYGPDCDDDTCVITPPPGETEHPVNVPGFSLSKSSAPASGTAVDPGQRVTYTVTGTNTGQTALDPAVITDDLSKVLNHAAYNGDAAATIAGQSAGAPTVTGDELSWSGALQPGQSVTITYSVTVDADAGGELLENSVSAEATPPGCTADDCVITPPPTRTEHPVNEPGFEVRKSSNPMTGSMVEGGDTVTYTVTGSNTGETVLDPASISDDLSKVLDKASYNADATATIAGTAAGTLSYDGAAEKLDWSGTLAVGQTVTITYSVTVNDDATGTLRNHAAGEATPPGCTADDCKLTPPPGETEHPIDPASGFAITKEADPASGTRVDPGQTITYTVTGENTGQTVLEPAELQDNLAEVFAYADYNGDVRASTGDVTVQGDNLFWLGDLAVGEKVTITYSVTVRQDAGGSLINNIVKGEATPCVPTDPDDQGGDCDPGTPILPPEERTEHPVRDPGFELAKSANPASGTAVDPGATITYTVTGTNSGETVLDPATISDDLSGVLAHARYNGDAQATIGGAAAAAPTVNGDELSWSGTLRPGEQVTITYSVRVNTDAAGVTVKNLATGEATPPNCADEDCVITPPPGETEHPVNVPGFSLSKASDPAAGTAVDPGQRVTYTVTGTNTGQTALDPAVITDDLSKVLNNAAYNGDAQATIGGVDAGDLEVQDDTLTWTGELAQGETVSITYSVTVNADAGGKLLNNRVEGEATPPGVDPDCDPADQDCDKIVPPPSETQHPVNEPGFEISKIANPASGTTVAPGQKVTYTVTGTNTGKTVLDPAVLNDDLSQVLKYAKYNGDARATVNGQPAGDLTVQGDDLAWNGKLAIGERVTITYSVTVNQDAVGKTLKNLVTCEATPPGGGKLTPPPVKTEHPVVPKGTEGPKNPLAHTGANLPWTIGGIGAALLVAGAILVGIRRRRNA